MINFNRRKLITGLVSFLAAPAIVRASSLMPIKVISNDILGPIPPYGKVMYYQDVLFYITDETKWR